MDKNDENKRSFIEQTVMTIVIAFGLGAVGDIIRNYYFAVFDKVNLGAGMNRAILYLGHLSFLLTFVLFAWLVKGEGKYFFSGLRRKSWIGAILGFITGFATMIICVMAASNNGNIVVKQGTGHVDMLPFIIGAAAVLIQASTEEIESRGFVFSRIYDKGGSGSQAIFLSAFYFALIHISKPGFGLVPLLTITAVGLVYVFSYYYFGSIWFACANHMMWNYTQDYICGLPNSGTPSEFSLMNTTFNSGGFFYDETFGIEGSWFAFIVISIEALAVYCVGRYYKSKTHKEFTI